MLLLYIPWKRLLWSSKLRLFLKDLLQMSQTVFWPVPFPGSRCFSFTCLLALSFRGICFRQKRQRKVLSGKAWRCSSSAPQTPSNWQISCLNAPLTRYLFPGNSTVYIHDFKLPMSVLPVIVQSSLFSKCHVADLTAVCEHVGQVLCFHVVSHICRTPVRKLTADVTEV